jgi:hypothetical protein
MHIYIYILRTGARSCSCHAHAMHACTHLGGCCDLGFIGLPDTLCAGCFSDLQQCVTADWEGNLLLLCVGCRADSGFHLQSPCHGCACMPACTPDIWLCHAAAYPQSALVIQASRRVNFCQMHCAQSNVCIGSMSELSESEGAQHQYASDDAWETASASSRAAGYAMNMS